MDDCYTYDVTVFFYFWILQESSDIITLQENIDMIFLIIILQKYIDMIFLIITLQKYIDMIFWKTILQKYINMIILIDYTA